MPGRIQSAAAAALFAYASILAGSAVAQPAYPAKAIRYVVPFPAGGPLDIVARAIGQELNKSWGQPVIIDNRPGAGGNIGADLVAKAPADGYTILMGAVSTHAINVTLYNKLPYDPIRDFAPVTLITSVPNVLVVHPSVPANNVKELIALAKSRPGQLNFASGSTGSAGHLAGELFNSMAGVRMTHIPYKGAAPAVVDLMAGHVSLMFDNMSSALPNIKTARVRALAVTTLKRSPLLPQLPTISEAGLRGFDVATWFGIFAPAGTPSDIVTRLNGEIVRILHTAEMKERLALLGAEPIGNKPDEFAAFVKAEIP
ncbi:MAG: tripartite tricarboxylate transporter substrate binding protein, partial [Betaproteobacteria bacterium]|nr:tripartite tricarboxylate transporter substrate binding protein [Betaproteobacteria bacterium]